MTPKRRLRNITVKEISLVRAGDNPPARVLLFKSREPDPLPSVGERFRSALATLRKRLGYEPSAATRAEVLEEIEKAKGGLPPWLQGKKPKDDAPDESADDAPDDADAEDADEPEDTEEADPDAEDREEDKKVKKSLAAILAELPEDERAVVSDALAARDAELTKLRPAAALAPDPLAALPAPVRKQIEADRAERAELRKQVSDLRTASERTAFAKALGPIQALPTRDDALVELLFGLPVEKRTPLVELLKAADALIVRGGVLGGGLGTERDSLAGSALAKIDALAVEMRKIQPTLSIEKARAAVLNDHPELYDQAEEERRGGGLH